jgi:hypothetical protein
LGSGTRGIIRHYFRRNSYIVLNSQKWEQPVSEIKVIIKPEVNDGF